MSVETDKTFRLSFKTEELKLIEEALTQLYIQVLNAWNSGTRTSQAHEKKALAEKLLFNVRLLLARTKKTGRRRAFYPWIQEHREILREMV